MGCVLDFGCHVNRVMLGVGGIVVVGVWRWAGVYYEW
jgi:hypothetical protein